MSEFPKKRRQKTGEVVLDMAAVFCEMNSEKLHTFKLVTLTKQYLFACPTEVFLSFFFFFFSFLFFFSDIPFSGRDDSVGKINSKK